MPLNSIPRFEDRVDETFGRVDRRDRKQVPILVVLMVGFYLGFVAFSLLFNGAAGESVPQSLAAASAETQAGSQAAD